MYFLQLWLHRVWLFRELLFTWKRHVDMCVRKCACVYLSAWLPSCMSICLSACLPSCLPNCLSTRFSDTNYIFVTRYLSLYEKKVNIYHKVSRFFFPRNSNSQTKVNLLLDILQTLRSHATISLHRPQSRYSLAWDYCYSFDFLFAQVLI